MPKLTITNARDRRVIEVSTDLTIDEILLNEGMLVERQCAGRGTCGRCRLKVKGALSEPRSDEIKRLGEAIETGWRLSCRVTLTGDAEVVLDSRSVHSDKVLGRCPRIEDLPKRLGLAIDLGTTTVAAFLVDIETAAIVAGAATLNKQAVHGADVISRMQTAIRSPKILEKLAVESIAEAIRSLDIPKAAVARIERAAVVGNTAMLHLLTGKSVARLIERPFEPHDKHAEVIRGFAGLLDSKPLVVVVAPVIGGFVGGDALACAVWFGMDRAEHPAIAADLGTNGEVIATDGKRIVAASAAAGPAFEGANISCGMRASPGAILKATWNAAGRRFGFDTVSEQKPVGIAGSGLLSLVRILKDIGVIEESGRIIDPAADSLGLVEKRADGKRIALGGGLFITQGDVRELQKAKGAIRATADILMAELKLTPGDMAKVYLTGSFGGRLDPGDALALGLIPPVAEHAIVSTANGAGFGAALFLDDDEFDRAKALANSIRHIELFDSPEFMDLYMDNMKLSP